MTSATRRIVNLFTPEIPHHVILLLHLARSKQITFTFYRSPTMYVMTFDVHCTSSIEHIVRCTYSVQCMPYSVQCTPYSVECTTYSVRRPLNTSRDVRRVYAVHHTHHTTYVHMVLVHNITPIIDNLYPDIVVLDKDNFII